MRLALLLFLLLGVAHAAETPDLDVTIKASELLAMKTRNESLWADNYLFVKKIRRLESELDDIRGAVDSHCGDIKSAQWVISRGG